MNCGCCIPPTQRILSNSKALQAKLREVHSKYATTVSACYMIKESGELVCKSEHHLLKSNEISNITKLITTAKQFSDVFTDSSFHNLELIGESSTLSCFYFKPYIFVVCSNRSRNEEPAIDSMWEEMMVLLRNYGTFEEQRTRQYAV